MAIAAGDWANIDGITSGNTIYQAQARKGSTWAYSEAPQPHLWPQEYETPIPKPFEETKPPAAHAPRPRPRPQNNPFRNPLKTPKTSHSGFWETLSSAGLGDRSPSPTNSFLEKRKRLRTYYPSHQWAPSPLEDSQPGRRDSFLPQQLPSSYSPARLADSRHLGATAPTRTCVSCADDLPRTDFSKYALTEPCQHLNSACKDCVKQWIVTRLENGNWNEIKCLECDEMMQYADVQRHADPEVFERYDLLAARSCLNSEENFMWCRSEGCDSGRVHEGGENMPLFRCVACRAKYCVLHEVSWHEGERCAAFDRRMNGEEPLEEGEHQSPTTIFPFGSELAQQQRSDAEFVRMNDRQDRKLISRRRESRTTTSNDQLARDFNYALALEHGDDDDPQYPSTSSNLWTQRPSSGYRRGFMQKLRDQKARQDFKRSYDPVSKARRSPARYGHDSAFARKLQKIPPDVEPYAYRWPTPYTHDPAFDASYAHNLHNQFEEIDGYRWWENEARGQPSFNEHVARQQANDAAAAQALHAQFEHKERERVQEREAYQRRKAEEQQGEQTVRANAKQCPSCGWFIQKKNGCDHMTCSKCKYEFCWLCLADYQQIRNGSNSAHNPGCRDYRR